MVRADVDIEYLHSVHLQLLHHLPVDRPHRFRADHAARNTGLIRQHDEAESDRSQLAHRFNSFVNPMKFLPLRHVFATWRPAVDRAVTINQQNAFHSQIALRQFPALRVGDAVIRVAADHARQGSALRKPLEDARKADVGPVVECEHYIALDQHVSDLDVIEASRAATRVVELDHTVCTYADVPGGLGLKQQAHDGHVRGVKRHQLVQAKRRVIIRIEKQEAVVKLCACLPNATAGIPFGGSVRIADLDTPCSAIAEIFANHFTTVAGKQQHAANSLLAHLFDQVFEERPPVHRRHRLGQGVGEWPHSGAEPATQDHRLPR